MNHWTLVWANLTRRRTRCIVTLLSVVFAFTLFGVLIALRQAFTEGARFAGDDRLITMSAVSLVTPLPLADARPIAAVRGVRTVNPQEWVGGYYRDLRHPIFALAVRARSFFSVYPGDRLPAAERRAWLADPRGIVIGPALERRYGWRIGEQIPLRSGVWPNRRGNTWEVVLDGILSRTQGSHGSLLLMHYRYLDDERLFGKGLVTFFVLRIADASQAGRISRTVDRLFANSPFPTRTATERSFLSNFASQFGDIGAIVSAVVGAVFFTMLLVTGNTMAQSVRERTAELALMKALGFGNARLGALALTESLAMTLIGGVLGLALAFALVGGFGYFSSALIEMLPGLTIPASAPLAGLALMLLFGLLAGLLPLARVARLRVAEALRET